MSFFIRKKFADEKISCKNMNLVENLYINSFLLLSCEDKPVRGYESLWETFKKPT